MCNVIICFVTKFILKLLVDLTVIELDIDFET